MSDKSISIQTLQRLPIYLNILKSLTQIENIYVSAKQIADILSLSEIQVRKDLSSVSQGGRPKIGYETSKLILDVEKFLGYDNIVDAIIVGAGRLGKALLAYEGFKEYGLSIVAAFDNNESIASEYYGNKMIMPIEKMKNICQRTKIQIGIITVPAKSAQCVCDMLIDCGITAIWNFAPVHLITPDNIQIKNENMAASLVLLSRHLIEKEKD